MSELDQERAASIRSRAEQAFEQYLDRAEGGTVPDSEAFLAEQPVELRTQLCRILDDYKSLRRTLGDGMARIAPGQRLDDYRLIEELGFGNYGAVWEAEQVSLGKRVALKILYPQYNLSKQALSRFRREARAGGRLQHPGIITVYAVGEHEGIHFIAQELVPGGFTLQDFMTDAREKPELPANYFRVVAELFAKIADALQAAHDAGVVHRDIKPANILLLDDSLPKVADFGMAKLIDPHVLSGSGERTGTPRYMSPEQAGRRSRKALDHRSDIFSLGSTLYEALTSRFAFEGDSWHQLLDRIQHEDPPDPQQIRSKVPDDLAVITMKALEKNPERRYQSMAEFAAELHRFLADEPILAKPPGLYARTAKWARRHPVISVSAVILEVALAFVTILLIQVTDERNRARAAEKKSSSLARDLSVATERWREKAREATAQSYLANIVAAEKSLSAHEDGPARRHLELCPVEHRGFEWRYLTRRADHSLLRIEESGRIFHQAVFHSEGRRIVGYSANSSLYRWDSASGKRIGKPAPLQAKVLALSSGGGSLSLLVRRSGRHEIWRPDQNARPVPIPMEGVQIQAHAFSENGDWLAASFLSNRINVWNTRSGARTSRVRRSEFGARTLAINSAGTLLVFGKNKSFRIYDLKHGRLLRVLSGHRDRITKVRFSTDDEWIATTSLDQTVRLWNAKTGKPLHVLRGHGAGIVSVAFSPDSSLLASGSADKTVRLWEVKTGRLLRVFRGHGLGVHSVAFSPDASRIVSCSGDRTIRVWHVHATDVFSVPAEEGYYCALLGPEGKRIYAGSRGGPIHVLDAATGRSLFMLRGHRTIVKSLAFDPQGLRLASGSWDNSVRIWDPHNRYQLRSLEGHEKPVVAIAWTADGKSILSASRDKTVKLWDVSSGRLLKSFPRHGMAIHSLAVSPRHELFATGDGRGQIRLWDIRTRKKLKSIDRTRIGSPVLSLAFSLDGKRLAAGSIDKSVRIWNVENGQLLMQLEGHSEGVGSVAYSKDGSRLLTASLDGTFRIWQSRSGNLLYAERRFSDGLLSAAFDATEERILTVSSTGNLRLFETMNDPARLEARVRYPRGLTAQPLAFFSPDQWAKQQTDVFESVIGDPRILASLRLALLGWYGRKERNPEDLARESWRILRRSDRDLESYDKALALAESAWQLDPGNLRCREALGIAQYRVGQFSEAIATLERVDQVQRREGQDPRPLVLAFLAMALEKSGDRDSAATTYGRLRRLFAETSTRARRRDLERIKQEVEGMFVK